MDREAWQVIPFIGLQRVRHDWSDLAWTHEPESGMSQGPPMGVQASLSPLMVRFWVGWHHLLWVVPPHFLAFLYAFRCICSQKVSLTSRMRNLSSFISYLGGLSPRLTPVILEYLSTGDSSSCSPQEPSSSCLKSTYFFIFILLVLFFHI